MGDVEQSDEPDAGDLSLRLLSISDNSTVAMFICSEKTEVALWLIHHKHPKKSCYGIIPKIYCPIPTPLPSDQFANDLCENLAKIGSNSQMYKLLLASRRYSVDKVESEFGLLPHGLALMYQAIGLPTTTIDHYPPFPLPPQPCTYSTVLNEKESTFYRASDFIPFKRIVSRVADFSTLATSLQKQKRSVQTQAMKRGLELDPDAAAQYEQETGNHAFPCGFIINPHAPHLGASPDRKVVDSTGVLGLLEIKCPDVDSVLECKYLSVKEDGALALKTSHEYHYQMIGQMGITGMTWPFPIFQCGDHWADGFIIPLRLYQLSA
ncbi:hypothetical protein G5714_000761 [Onychostoma macrolepis]|uniref:YqaJ viral recombinase domain-containing protein n=1 Tax=Onychostoma macrolepis TaxID=369639 RepID=A0A7J6DHG1_9TELE|nr:hypothetical protein G5714_000761 [Onychostoma macrolepis]